ncbi:unnamed protein product [Cylicostephanus goldi]|uniref:Uncharacterized protein n=1 Tax=Cylicostephanus goldi TaxID=71465 RepID=A0A3P6TH44_CYLGO|nr:unnamed protein product [Cylicostephanus goldi]
MMADPLGPSFASGAVVPKRPKIVKHKKIAIIEHHSMPTIIEHHPMPTILEHHPMPTILEHHPMPTIIEHHPMHAAAVIRRFFKPIPHIVHDQDLDDGMARKKRSVP